MSTEILQPFQLSQNGQVGVTTDSDVQAEQHVNSLISTTPGSRVMLPTYGVDLTGQLFGQSIQIVSAQVQSDVTNALGLWEPGINVSQVTPVAGPYGSGIVSVNVEYSTPTDTNNATALIQTGTILPGGSFVGPGGVTQS